MDWYLAAVWGTVIFGVLTVLLLLLWFVGGKTSTPLRIAGGISGLLCMASFAYMTYGV